MDKYLDDNLQARALINAIAVNLASLNEDLEAKNQCLYQFKNAEAEYYEERIELEQEAIIDAIKMLRRIDL